MKSIVSAKKKKERQYHARFGAMLTLPMPKENMLPASTVREKRK